MEISDEMNSVSSVTLNTIIEVTATPEPDAYNVVCNVSDADGTYDIPFFSRPNDTNGLGPAVRQWLADNEGSYDIEPNVPPDVPEPVIIVYPVDLWSRLTDDEADQVEAAMAAQPVRIQNIFKSASSYRSDHEIWPLLTSMATDLCGATRAAEILAASAIS